MDIYLGAEKCERHHEAELRSEVDGAGVQLRRAARTDRLRPGRGSAAACRRGGSAREFPVAADRDRLRRGEGTGAVDAGCRSHRCDVCRRPPARAGSGRRGGPRDGGRGRRGCAAQRRRRFHHRYREGGRADHGAAHRRRPHHLRRLRGDSGVGSHRRASASAPAPIRWCCRAWWFTTPNSRCHYPPGCPPPAA